MDLQERINADPEIRDLIEKQAAQIQQQQRLIEALQRQLAEVLLRLEHLQPTAASTTPSPSATSNHRDRSRRRKRKPKSPAEKKKPRRAPLPEHLERIEQIEVVSVCPTCAADDLAEVSEEISEKLDYVPAKLVVRRLIRKTVRCRCCRGIATAPLPPLAVPSGQLASGFLAHLVYSKCALHLPLSRIAEDLSRQDVSLASSTLCDAMGQAADLLEPVVASLKSVAFDSDVLQMDGTGIDVLIPRKAGKYRGQMTVYCTDGETPITLYDFSSTKAGKHFSTFLNLGQPDAYSGYLISDSASNMDVLSRGTAVVRCGCWQHVREHFVTARPNDPVAAAKALSFIRELFDIERASDEAGERAAERLSRRRRDSVGVLERFEVWMAEIQRRYLPSEEMWKAIQYCGNHRVAQRRFLDDGRIPIHNNLSERELGVIGRGRKNYLFAGSDVGGQRLGILYSVVRTCQRLEVDPWMYLNEVLPRLSAVKANRGWSRRLDELLPMAFQKAAEQKMAG